ncbi:carboxypeptidase-like regulatory domain-containing protein [Acidipila sp. EB88]|uniref:TonB-dependent receptor n=1 Tax=Acidipila sp. EB88 TaxID=2305226 RepID=UPI000F5DAF6D|nr:carboxypeptidase-like regulatory domain-containing protein [Acidipila sp. EB88]RRA48608.1 TonB-dependent receptor [Acidipila sp. EB88]
MRRIQLFSLKLLLAFCCAFALGAFAQENATVTGTISDSTGAVVPNVAVTLTNPATNQTRETQSSSSGSYVFDNLAIGNYTLSATAPGFQRFSETNIVVNVAQTLKEDVLLVVGSAGQTVTVQANALQVQTETNELSNLITGQQVVQLATNGRNVTALAALGLGVSNTLPAFAGVNALTSANGLSFNGTRTSHNIYLLDGGELNDRGCGGCFSSLPSMDALAEFRTLSSNYGPDYGLGSGGTITMVLKSGSHDFHGELWEFNRNEDYDANNYFSNLAGQQRPEFRLNEPGGNIGGPVWIPGVYNKSRDRTFFFVNEEWRRLIQGTTPTTANTIAASNFAVAGQNLTYTVPGGGTTPIVPVTTDPAKLALYAADGLTAGQPFPAAGTGQVVIPSNLFDPNAVLELNAGTFPRPNFGTSQFVSSVPAPTNVHEDVIRIDHKINEKLQLMGHYLHDSVTQNIFPPLWGDSSYPTVGTLLQNPSWSSTIKLTQVLSPTLLNETAFLYSGNTIHLSPLTTPGNSFTQPSGWSATTFFPSSNNAGLRLPEIDLGAPYGTNWSSNYFPWKNSYEGYQTRDDLSWNKGKHQMKFGFTWLHDPKNQQLQANTQGTAVFSPSTFSQDSYINFILGDAASFTQLNYLAGKHWVNDNYGFYANDNWHIIPKLTLNLGIRFDALPHAFERFNQFGNFNPNNYNFGLGDPVNADGTLNPASLQSVNGGLFYLNGIQEAGVNGFPRGVVQNNYGTWQPRIGYAYDINGDGKTVWRGGFGLFFERVQGNDVYNAALNPPFAYQPSATNVYFSNPNTSALTGATTSQAFPSTLTNLSYIYPNPATAMFSMGVQRQLAPSIVGVVQYAGSLGWHQSDDRSINTLPLANLTARQGVANGTLNANLYRNYPGYSTITQEETTTNFSYHSLQVGLNMVNKHGFTVNLAYTYSHEIDDVSTDLTQVSNPYNIGYDRGSGSFDRRHDFNANYIYDFPFFLHSSNAVERMALGGWSISGITTAETGTPAPITYNGPDVLGLGGGTTNRPNLVAPVQYPHTRLAWFNKASFASPVAPWVSAANGNEGFGSAGKDAVVGPGLYNTNLSLFKSINFRERGPSLQIRFETFNTFNHTEPNAIDQGTNDGNFGQVTSTYDPRTVQLGAKFSF